MEKTICVLVLYNPNFDIIDKVIGAIIFQVDCVYIADNSPISVKDMIMQSPKIIYEKMAGNIGIAAAQNCGIEYAVKNKFDYLFFLDQDSICPNLIIKKLCFKLKRIKTLGINVGAVGPRAINRGSGKPYKGLVKKGTRITEELTEVSELISSATLIEVETFYKVGYMDISLFIDGVDHEWCWRATSKEGCKFFIDESMQLSHQLGEGDRYFLWKKVAIPTPFRTYYQFRNYFILCRRNYVPLYWKIANGIKYIIKICYFPLFVSPRLEYLTNIWNGIFDGILYRKR